jgi:hypothetical protein
MHAHKARLQAVGGPGLLLVLAPRMHANVCVVGVHVLCAGVKCACMVIQYSLHAKIDDIMGYVLVKLSQL